MLPAPQTVAVVRALQLGDMLCCVPALRGLRAAWPQAHIALVGLPWAHDFVRRFSAYLDEFIEFPGYPGLPERGCDVAAFPDFLSAMQRRRFDLVLQLHGSGRVMNPIVQLFSAKRSAGYCDGYCPSPDFLPWQPQEHEVLRPLRLLEHLGIRAQGTALEFPLEREDFDAWRALEAGHALHERAFVCVHPGSQLPSRRWSPERFAAVADRLAERGFAVVLTGTAGEAALTARVSSAMKRSALDLTGRTTLGSLALLVSRARLLICNDTGLSHVAVAMRTPSVVVSCGGDTRRWAPLDATRHRVLHHPIACRPCAHVACPIGHPCAEAIHVDDVIAAADELLAVETVPRKELPACVL